MACTDRALVQGIEQRDKLAELIANGMGIVEAGQSLGIARSPTKRHWAKIKADLGPQAV